MPARLSAIWCDALEIGSSMPDNAVARAKTPTSAVYCDAAGTCVQCLDATHCAGTTDQCKQAACNAGTCGLGPKPSGTFCNGFEDQCDGAGNCVDCVNSGGCGECCTCSAAKVCVPA